MLAFQTQRLELREFLSSDAPHFFKMNNDPEVQRFTGDGAFESVAATRAFIEAYDAYDKWGFGRWTVVRKEDGAVMGWCGLKDHPDEGYVDLGFRLLREYRGNGYATEAGKACIEWAWKKGIPHLAGRVMESNVKSIRVLEKLGFRDWQPLEADEHCGLISILKNPRS